MSLPGQAQKELFVNEAFALLDALVPLEVSGRTDAPAAQPSDGECWIVAPDAQGEWSGKVDSIAIFAAGGWTFLNPFDGMQVMDRTQGCRRCFSQGWQTPTQPQSPEGGGTIDAEARVAIVQLIQILRDFRFLGSD